MSKGPAHIDQIPYKHKKGYLGVTYQNCDMFIRLVGNQIPLEFPNWILEQKL